MSERVYVCGKITGSGTVLMTIGRIYRYKKNCQRHCEKLNAKNPKFIFRVLVADNWRLVGDDD